MAQTLTDRIIDRDCDFYRAEIEFCERAVRNVRAESEPYWKERARTAGIVFQALKAHRDAIDDPSGPCVA